MGSGGNSGNQDFGIIKVILKVLGKLSPTAV